MDFSDIEYENDKRKIKNLEEMSIEALAEYIEDLQSKIFQAEQMIVIKKRALEGANKFFTG